MHKRFRVLINEVFHRCFEIPYSVGDSSYPPQIEIVKHKIIKIYEIFDSVNYHLEESECVFGERGREIIR